jgi:hypothetical protein
MKKDIQFPPVEGVKIAITRATNELDQAEWRVYLINRNRLAITNVFVTSRGYGEKDNEPQKTSTLRHYFAEVGPESHHLVEPIDASVFHLTNEYWVSYFIDGQIYDKKFIFVPGSLEEANLIPIDQLDMEGVLHE